MNGRHPFHLSRRAFTALAATAVPAVNIQASESLDRRAHFERDLARSYECQHVAVDMDDVSAVLKGMRTAMLGVGTALGPNRAEQAAKAALLEAGTKGKYAIAVLAFAPGEARLAAYRLALNTLRLELHPNVTVIYGGCFDEYLASGSVRVSLLIG